jgi:hypothetical protein
VFDKDRHALESGPPRVANSGQLLGDDETTRVFDKDDQTGDEETTRVFDQDRHVPVRLPPKAGGTKIGLGVPKPPGIDRPLPPPAAAIPSDRPSLKGPPPMPGPASSDRVGTKTVRIERRSERPPAKAPAETVIVQEHTDPAIFRQSGSLFGKAAHWVWDDPAKRGFRVGLPAGIIVFVAVFFAASGHSGNRHRSSPKPSAAELTDTAREVATNAAAREEPRGVDPATLPPADEEAEDDGSHDKKSKTRRASHGSTPAEQRVAAVEPPPPSPAPPPASPAAPPPLKPVAVDPAPAAPPAKPAADDDIESPYGKSAPAAATKPAATKPAAKPKKSAAADCSQPFTVDENGIKRIRPECL